ncbi:MAG: hypothetical protein JWP69_1822 [Flaviaesturariibacter sp.]|nr:hypothetical protein [Flaviaesturariibacter sp.]
MQPDWEFWIDSQISPIIAKWLIERRGYSAKSSYSLGILGIADIEIYKLAKKQGNVIILSKDTDFTNIIQTLGSPPKLINVVLGNCRNDRLWQVLDVHLTEIIRLFTEQEIDIIELK